jgi:hypothetical protein
VKSITEKTINLINYIFSADERNDVMLLLINECGSNLPHINEKSPLIERIRFAAIKISNGKKKELIKAIELAKTDWRDLLVSAGFEHDINEYNIWADTIL